ncbi:MAG TPA: Uma2 family endonuclease, partial [Kribbella sp.]
MSLVERIPDQPAVPWRPFGPLTRDDLDRLPNDGHRYELVDGALLVTPAPVPRHQVVCAAIYRALFAACPPHLQVLFAPLDVVLTADTVMQPDLLVAPRDAFSERDLQGPPLLAVEVLSPSTRRIDLMLKFSRYEAAGCPAYWVVDPDTPSLIAWELQDGTY